MIDFQKCRFSETTLPLLSIRGVSKGGEEEQMATALKCRA